MDDEEDSRRSNSTQKPQPALIVLKAEARIGIHRILLSKTAARSLDVRTISRFHITLLM
jgi:hypothetical protein